jgi:hypothetical protein
MYDLEAVREDAINATLAHYKVAGVLGWGIKAGRGILNAGRAASTAYKGFTPVAGLVGDAAKAAPGAIGTAYNAFRGAGGLHHMANIGMGLGAVGATGLAAGAGLRMAGVGGQQQQQGYPRYV